MTQEQISKEAFIQRYGMLDEACRQWYAFIQEDSSRADGVGFEHFCNELCEMKYQDYLENPSEFDLNVDQARSSTGIYAVLLTADELRNTEEAVKARLDREDNPLWRRHLTSVLDKCSRSQTHQMRSDAPKETPAMEKEEFWRFIDHLNATTPRTDRDAYLCRAVELLSQHTPEEIMDWHLIHREYDYAAQRDDLWTVCSDLGAHDTDDGFTDFRSWLISRGKEAYLAALRDPGTVAEVPLADGESRNFELIGYTASYAYEVCTRRLGLNGSTDLYEALSSRELNGQTRQEIQTELLENQSIPVPISARQAQIAKMLESLDKVHAYVYDQNGCTEYLFRKSPENIANFLGRRPFVDRMVLTDPMDRLILNTFGNFIDQCPDKTLLEEIKETLIPIQMGDAEVQPFFCPSLEEVEAYLEQREINGTMEMGGM